MKTLSTVTYAVLYGIVSLLVLAGCAHSQDQVALTPEKRSEAQSIERAQSNDDLTPMEADLQKDALRHHINF